MTSTFPNTSGCLPGYLRSKWQATMNGLDMGILFGHQNYYRKTDARIVQGGVIGMYTAGTTR